MDQSKTFAGVSSLDELSRVNDAQKAVFKAMVAASGGSLWEQRQLAYLTRWREALVHIGRHAILLDIGGGWPIDRVWEEVIGAHRITYHLLDIDAAIVADARDRLPRYGLPAGNANVGINVALPYDDAKFDVVFSSHCIEHSPDLPQTLSEIFRVLKPNGRFIFAVPFGFDDSDEHLLCLDIDSWIVATEMAGFEVLNYHLGQTYPMAGWDLFVVAERRPEQLHAQALKELSSRYTKAGRTFVAPGTDLFRYFGNMVESGPHRVLNTMGSAATITSSRPIHGVLFVRHRWSGIIEIAAGQQKQIYELYSRPSYIQLLPVKEAVSSMEIRVVGKSRGGEQAALHGVLL